MSVLILNTLSEYNDEVLELQNQICAQAEGSEVVCTKDMKYHIVLAAITAG